ncbi:MULTISPECIES: amino acid ABC transporter permease [Comamonas]|jgi:polar amino acid transport system permease protein|uniref:Inner membrane amino-acid ABC transporter permease protein yecS n=1 Tax=Comamonas aquatica TaxID=225991 RepID=A0AA35D991_9BURK|nr:amino acid ABC transporter permease [Comamonas aquatica]MDE1556747.1 amino acid ABC transporter permease [Comamonas aquatica]MDH0494038.1 amino acid ABC transporter permease [Comamonas aquatica]MDH1673270.1 amino acid ABC transporter permease [Comamonas aquatica]MDH1678470.1 amino acid ABC transporter permease [Comamonas aquatica]CAB5675788.1 Inner membrane amino-acid ABC transporter permease protein yecS [Comamonas aquatica]
MEMDFLPVLANWPMLLKGLVLTVVLTGIALPLGMLLGVACAWARLHGGPLLRTVVASYVEVFRNTPFIIQLFFLFFGLPSLGLRMSPETASILAMTLNLGAYACEQVRAGIEATPRGQIEAAQCLALSRWQIFTRVVLPPSLGRVWPALTGQMIIVMLGSAVCSQISTEEISYAANLISSRTFRSFESYIVVTLSYLLLAVLLRQALNWLGPRFVFGQRRA